MRTESHSTLGKCVECFYFRCLSVSGFRELLLSRKKGGSMVPTLPEWVTEQRCLSLHPTQCCRFGVTAFEKTLGLGCSWSGLGGSYSSVRKSALSALSAFKRALLHLSLILKQNLNSLSWGCAGRETETGVTLMIPQLIHLLSSSQTCTSLQFSSHLTHLIFFHMATLRLQVLNKLCPSAKALQVRATPGLLVLWLQIWDAGIPCLRVEKFASQPIRPGSCPA